MKETVPRNVISRNNIYLEGEGRNGRGRDNLAIHENKDNDISFIQSNIIRKT